MPGEIDLTPEEDAELDAANDQVGARVLADEFGLSPERIRELQARRYEPEPGAGPNAT